MDYFPLTILESVEFVFQAINEINSCLEDMFSAKGKAFNLLCNYKSSKVH